jgi:hypothetical protein
MGQIFVSCQRYRNNGGESEPHEMPSLGKGDGQDQNAKETSSNVYHV